MKFPRSFQTIVLTLVVVGLLLLAVSGYLTPLTRLAYAPFISLQTWFSGRYLAVQKLLNTPRDVALLAQENARLNAEVARLQGQIIELQQQNVELQVLSALLDFAQTYPENEYASAAVI